jgi:hypothetical protein
VLGIPGKRFGSSKPNSLGQVTSSHPFRSVPFSTSNTTISGVTKDSGGTPLGFCTVDLYLTGSEISIAQTISDASGNYNFDNPGSGPFFIVAYLAGAPDLAGTTVNTIVGV